LDLRAIPPEILVAIAAIAVLLALVALGRAWIRGVRARARSARAYAGERAAAKVLRAHGFAIVGAQVPAEYPVEVDGETILCGLRADYVVSKNGARFVAEVKTGALAPRIETASTRRQLLEYEIAFGVDGVLLVDVERDVVHSVTFPTLDASRARPRRQAAGKNGG
jgi:hypothetical protein